MSMDQPLLVQRMREIADAYDLDSLMNQITAGLADLPEAEQPFVPTSLATALHRFINSYGESRRGPLPPA
jgi:hypothetical protein